MFEVSEPEPPDDAASITATVTGLAALIAVGVVVHEFWLRRTMGGWHTANGSKWAARIGAVITLAGLAYLALNMGAKLARRWKGRVVVIATALSSLLLGTLCLMDETVRVETALLFNRMGVFRPWELSLANDPNAWLRYQLLRGCGTACVVVAFGLMGSTIRDHS